MTVPKARAVSIATILLTSSWIALGDVPAGSRLAPVTVAPAPASTPTSSHVLAPTPASNPAPSPVPAAPAPPALATTASNTVLPASPPPKAPQNDKKVSARWHPPDFAPSRLEFAPVWDGETARKTLAFKTTTAGAISAVVPNGPFRISEMRIMGGLTQTGGPKSMGGISQPTIQTHQVKVRQTSAPWQITSEANEDVEIDVVFAPKFDLFTMGAGPKTSTLTVKGLAQTTAWTMNVPIAGTFNGKRIGVVFVAGAAEIPVVSGESQVVLPLTLYGSGTPTTGTIRAKNMPKGATDRWMFHSTTAEARRPRPHRSSLYRSVCHGRRTSVKTAVSPPSMSWSSFRFRRIAP